MYRSLFVEGHNVYHLISLTCTHSRSFNPHPAIAHCSHLLLKSRVATNISHWLKVQSRWFKNYIFARKCILISFWIFKYCFYYSFTLYCFVIFRYCFFFKTIQVSKSSDPNQARHFVGPDLGPICLQRLSADNKSHP